MDMQTVELAYHPTAKDLTAGLLARRKVSPAGRRGLWLMAAMPVFAALITAIDLPRGRFEVFPTVMLPVLAVLLFFTPHLQARSLAKVAARNGLYRATVDESGVTTAHDGATTMVRWAAQSRFRETKDVFVMLSDDKNATCFSVLPKRGMQNEESLDTLRAILDRNLTRL
ncbi:YcxB family protein [Streptomyces sp. NPDC005813]|uniref:YcxB family protein n=1 Tax=Streptomyces sp. NPDC005813 TaxID=3155592 RepID=UPI0033D957CF